MKLLKLALEKQDYNLAAHILVYGLIKAKVDQANNAHTETSHKSNANRKSWSGRARYVKE